MGFASGSKLLLSKRRGEDKGKGEEGARKKRDDNGMTNSLPKDALDLRIAFWQAGST